jgi:hypothetical protein
MTEGGNVIWNPVCRCVWAKRTEADMVFAFVGVVAGLWHILWIAGMGILASGIVSVGVHAAGYMRLERDREIAENPAIPRLTQTATS